MARTSAHSRRAGRSGIHLTLATTLFALAACDVPTSPPKWDTTWVIPAESTTMEVSSLLPNSVSVTDDESAFVLSLDGTNINQSLGDLCSVCSFLDGTQAPKPAFSDTIETSVELPAEVVSATVTGGMIRVRLYNGFNFDPVRPSAAARGSIEIAIVSGTDTLATATIDGNAQSFLPFSTQTLDLQLAPTTLSGPIRILVAIDSPEGDDVTIDAGLQFSAEAEPGEILVGEAEVELADKAVDMDPVDLDLEDIDEELTDRIHGGAFRLDITNPFTAEGTLTLQITSPVALVTKTVTLQQGENSQRVEFTGDELRSILGQSDVVMTAVGTVSSPSGTVTVTPSMSLVMKSDLEMVIGAKDEEE